MPMQLLARLCAGEIPLILEDDDDIEKCHALVAEKLVVANVPPVQYKDGCTKRHGVALVTRITASGEAAVRTQRHHRHADHHFHESSSAFLSSCI